MCVCVCVCVDASLSEFYACYLCASMCVSRCLCARSCGCVHVCNWDHSSPGFRFLSCSTASHLAPVPKIVMLERRKRQMRDMRIKRKIILLGITIWRISEALFSIKEDKKDKHNSTSRKWKTLSIMLGEKLNLRHYCQQWQPSQKPSYIDALYSELWQQKL